MTPPGKSSCPRPEAVWAELETLIPREQLAREQSRANGQPLPAAGAGGPPSQLEIIDLGPRYRVIAGGRVRDYKDEAHDCDHRARVAAVFVALSLAPAYFGQPPAPPPPPPPPAVVEQAPPPAPPPPQASRHSMWVNVGASYAAGLSTDRHGAPGVSVRLAFARASWGLGGGFTVPLPTDATVNGLRLREFRLPGDVGVRAALHGSDQIALAAELGLTLAWLSERALDLATGSTQSGIEWGARVALTLRLAAASRIAPFLAAHVELVPQPTSLWAIPRGQVGRSPAGWVGLTAGGSLGW